MDVDVQEGIAGGLCFTDSPGVNLQVLSNFFLKRSLCLVSLFSLVATEFLIGVDKMVGYGMLGK